MKITDGDIAHARETGVSEKWIARARRAGRYEALGVADRLWVAWCEDTRPAVLARLARDERWEVRAAVAEHPAARPATLARLSRDERWEVRAEVARHPATPVRVRERLARDDHYEVRFVRAVGGES